MAKKALIKKPVVPVPQDLEEAAKFLRRIGQEQRRIKEMESAFNEEIAKLTAKAMAKTKSNHEKISQLFEGLFYFAEANRQKLTQKGERKTVELPTGLFGWRLTPWAISIDNEEKVIASLKSLGLTEFLRVKEEVDKTAMLKEKEKAKTIEGVSFSQNEKFLVKPSETHVEISSGIDQLKKAV